MCPSGLPRRCSRECAVCGRLSERGLISQSESALGGKADTRVNFPRTVTAASAPELANGTVQAVLTDWTLPPIDLWAVFPSGRMATTKARVFVAFVEHLLNEHHSGVGVTG